MGMPETPQNGMNITPDGTIYEMLEDGTIKRIGKVSSNGEFEPFGGPKDGVCVRDGFIYRVINGKEQKIGRILPNGDIESISQRIKSEAEISRNKVKIVAIVSVLIAFIIGAGIYLFEEEQKGKEPLEKVLNTPKSNAETPQPAEDDRKACEFARSNSQNNAEAWEFYLKEFPEGWCADEAKEVISRYQEIEREKEITAQKVKEVEAYQKAKELNTRAAWEDYLREFPEGEHVFEAKFNKDKMKKIGSLEWSDRSQKNMDWNAAKQYCKNLTEGGYNDWRLPNIDELRTTIRNCSKTETGGQCKVSGKNGRLSRGDWNPEGSCYCESRNNNGGYYSKLGDDDNVWLWSSSTRSDNTDAAWGVYFRSGRVGSHYKSYEYDAYVRCVR